MMGTRRVLCKRNRSKLTSLVHSHGHLFQAGVRDKQTELVDQLFSCDDNDFCLAQCMCSSQDSLLLVFHSNMSVLFVSSGAIVSLKRGAGARINCLAYQWQPALQNIWIESVAKTRLLHSETATHKTSKFGWCFLTSKRSWQNDAWCAELWVVSSGQSVEAVLFVFHMQKRKKTRGFDEIYPPRLAVWRRKTTTCTLIPQPS